MKEIIVEKLEAGQRFDKFLGKYLNQASTGFIYKMLRKKNITLNDKKAAGKEILKKGDSVKIFFAADTLEKFTGTQALQESVQSVKAVKLDIIYEDEHIILINKPAGMLSQKAKPEDTSLVEYVTAYLLESNQLTREDLSCFKPGICNRLDRNTSGIVVAGKSMAGLQAMNEVFKDRSIHKFYQCPVWGNIEKTSEIQGYLKKNENTNTVKITDSEKAGGQFIRTRFSPLEQGRNATLLEVELITGRSHQIRAHLSSIGHPLFGDSKYGDSSLNRQLWDKFHLKSQLLHSYRLEMPALNGELAYLSGRCFTAPLPENFRKIWAEFKI